MLASAGARMSRIIQQRSADGENSMQGPINDQKLGQASIWRQGDFLALTRVLFGQTLNPITAYGWNIVGKQ